MGCFEMCGQTTRSGQGNLVGVMEVKRLGSQDTRRILYLAPDLIRDEDRLRGEKDTEPCWTQGVCPSSVVVLKSWFLTKGLHFAWGPVSYVADPCHTHERRDVGTLA